MRSASGSCLSGKHFCTAWKHVTWRREVLTLHCKPCVLLCWARVPFSMSLKGCHGLGHRNKRHLLACRIEGVKRVTLAAVGEKHSLALQSWCSAPLSMRARLAPGQALAGRPGSGLGERALSRALSEGLAGPIDSMEALLATEARPQSERDSAAYWQSLEVVPGPGSRWAALIVLDSPQISTKCAEWLL